MDKSETVEFVDELKRLYPYDFKGGVYAEWYEALKEQPCNIAWRALRTYSKDCPKVAPTVRQIVESITKYNGMPDLIYTAIARRQSNG